MKDMISQLHEWIKLVSQVGIGLIGAWRNCGNRVWDRCHLRRKCHREHNADCKSDWWAKWLCRTDCNSLDLSHFSAEQQVVLFLTLQN